MKELDWYESFQIDSIKAKKRQALKRKLAIGFYCIIGLFLLTQNMVSHSLYPRSGGIRMATKFFSPTPGNSEAIDKVHKLIASFSVSPVDLVVDGFENHDVVILGETHFVKATHDWLPESIPVIFRRSGVRDLAIEAESSQQDMMDTLLGAKDWNQTNCLELAARLGIPFVSFTRLMHSLHGMNKELLPENKVHVHLVDLPPTSKRNYNARNIQMARRIQERVLNNGRKCLFYCGAGHGYLDLDEIARNDSGKETKYWDSAGKLLEIENPGRVFVIKLFPRLHRGPWLPAIEAWSGAPFGILVKHLQEIDCQLPSHLQNQSRVERQGHGLHGIILLGTLLSLESCDLDEDVFERTSLFYTSEKVFPPILPVNNSLTRRFSSSNLLLNKLLFHLYFPDNVLARKKIYIGCLNRMLGL